MYNSHYELVYNQKVDGIKIKVLNQDDSVVMTEFELKKGTLLPEHIHLTGHSAYLIKGNIRMVIDNVSRNLVQGDSWFIAKKLCHYTEALEDSVVLEVYSPDSEDVTFYQLAAGPELQS
jgi:quercetin dioxygenase-like cupin family protein